MGVGGGEVDGFFGDVFSGAEPDDGSGDFGGDEEEVGGDEDDLGVAGAEAEGACEEGIAEGGGDVVSAGAVAGEGESDGGGELCSAQPASRGAGLAAASSRCIKEAFASATLAAPV